MNIPCIVIAGTQSGVGKTSVTLALVVLLRRAGLRVQTFKVGPDYLDPSYLTMASGRPCYNLDGWMTGEAYVRRLLARVCSDADIAVVEGVMGLFDGAEATKGEGSTAEIARWLQAPVVLVADAHGMGRSLAALVHGYTSFDPELRLGGVIANRCGSSRHAELLADALQSASLPPLLGHVRRGALPELPSRHLGLVTADEKRISAGLLDQLADALSEGVSLDRVLAAARQAAALPEPNTTGTAAKGESKTVRLGIARDEAFHFYYPDNLDALECAGCELVPFSPLHDRGLPSGLHGLYFGGGYPEEHAPALAAKGAMLEGIRAFAVSGGVIYAECGGLMYLSQGIETLDGTRHALVQWLPAWTRMRQQRQSLGYVEVALTRDSLWGPAGTRLRGHEFHYSELVDPPDWDTVYEVRSRRAAGARAEGYQQGAVLASYAHLHFASHPLAVEHFVRRLQQTKEKAALRAGPGLRGAPAVENQEPVFGNSK